MWKVQEAIGARQVDQLLTPDLDLIEDALSRRSRCGRTRLGGAWPSVTGMAIALRAILQPSSPHLVHVAHS
jgi:hypothetical protein